MASIVRSVLAKTEVLEVAPETTLDWYSNKGPL